MDIEMEIIHTRQYCRLRTYCSRRRKKMSPQAEVTLSSYLLSIRPTETMRDRTPEVVESVSLVPLKQDFNRSKDSRMLPSSLKGRNVRAIWNRRHSYMRMLQHCKNNLELSKSRTRTVEPAHGLPDHGLIVAKLQPWSATKGTTSYCPIYVCHRCLILCTFFLRK